MIPSRIRRQTYRVLDGDTERNIELTGRNSTANYEWGKTCARVRKENLRRRKTKMDVLPMPGRPEPLVLSWPVTVTEREPDVVVRAPEREFLSERKGKDYFPRGVVDGRPLGTETYQVKGVVHGLPDGAGHDGVHELLGKAVASARMPA